MIAWFEHNPHRTVGLRRMFEGLLHMAVDAPDHAGVVLLAAK